jgi:hypothetical protein
MAFYFPPPDEIHNADIIKVDLNIECGHVGEVYVKVRAQWQVT